MDNFKVDLHGEVMREYEAIRDKNNSIYQKTKEQIYNHFPRIEEIDKALSKISLDACKMILSSNCDQQQVIDRLKRDTQSLIKEKEAILKGAGMPLDCMDEIYNCPVCKDKGSVDNRWCSCYYEKLQRLMKKRSNINDNNLHSFANFDVSLYSDKRDEEYGISPRENAENIYKTALKYASFDEGISKQLLLYGSPGLGKTFTSDCIAKEFIKNGKDVFYTSAPRLFTIFEDYKFGRNTSREAKSLIDYIQTVDLLIIDDLGTEFRTQYIDSILFDIINTRTNENKYMIISTNLTPMQLEATYSQRISSRILGNFEIMLFFGNDLRLESK